MQEDQETIDSETATQDSETGTDSENGKAVLKIFDPEGGCANYSLKQEKTIIGRSEKADIILSDQAVSRQHATIHKKNNLYNITDTDSHIGISINGNKCKSANLHNGDSIQIAQYVIEFRTSSCEREKLIVQSLPQSITSVCGYNFGFLPSGMKVSYRIVACPPSRIFRTGDTISVGRGGIILPVSSPLPSSFCVEIMLVWPDKRSLELIGEILTTIGRREKMKYDLLCIKLHRLPKEKFKHILATSRCSAWHDAPETA